MRDVYDGCTEFRLYVTCNFSGSCSSQMTWLIDMPVFIISDVLRLIFSQSDVYL